FLQVFEEAGVFHRLESTRCVDGDERPLSLHFDQQFRADELAERVADRHATDGEFVAQFVFRRDLRSGRILAVEDAVAQQVVNLMVERKTRLTSQRRAAAPCDRFHRLTRISPGFELYRQTYTRKHS